jgi:hypothetical protein
MTAASPDRKKLNLDRVLDRIQKLLALAENTGATPAEAAVAAEKASNLLFRYNLTIAQVTARSNRPAQGNELADSPAIGTGVWRRDLMWAISRPNFCRGVYNSGRRRFKLLGEKSNIEVVQYLYSYLERELERLAREAWRQLPEPERRAQSANTFRADFFEAAVHEIKFRLLRQFQTNQKADGASTALVVTKDRVLDETLAKTFPRLGTDYRAYRGSFSQSGRVAGREAGLSVGIHRGVRDGAPAPSAPLLPAERQAP